MGAPFSRPASFLRTRMRSHSLLFFLLLPLPLAGEPCTRQVAVMGTVLSVRVEAAPGQDPCAVGETAIVAVEKAERRLSTWREDSELAAFNRAPFGAFLPLSPELCRELSAALAWTWQTGGAFDPTVGSLVRAYDLRGAGRWPNAAELGAARAAVGYRKLVLRGCELAKTAPGLVLEEGGFGKGAALDAALAALAGHARAAELNLGGQVLFWGGGEHEVALVHPDRRGEVVATWTVPAGSVATSGNGERGLMVAGKRLGHLLDPRTGRPARDFGSVAVWAPDALTADCLSTALYVLGPREGARLLARHRQLAAVFLVREGRALRLWATPNCRGKLVPRGTSVTVDEIAWPGKTGQREDKP